MGLDHTQSPPALTQILLNHIDVSIDQPYECRCSDNSGSFIADTLQSAEQEPNATCASTD